MTLQINHINPTDLGIPARHLYRHIGSRIFDYWREDGRYHCEELGTGVVQHFDTGEEVTQQVFNPAMREFLEWIDMMYGKPEDTL